MSTPGILSSKVTNRLLQWTTYGIALLPVVPNNINSMLMIAWAALSLVHYFFSPREVVRFGYKGWATSLLLGGNFLLFVVSLLYTAHVKEGAEQVVAVLPMLFFPVIFFLLPPNILLTRRTINNTILIFWAATTLLGIWLLINYWRLDLLRGIGQLNSFTNPFRIVSDELTDKHPSYLSLFFGFSICIAAINLINKNKPVLKIACGLSIPLFLFHLLLLAARTPLFAILLGLFVILLLRVRSNRHRIILAASMLAGSIVLIRFTPAIFSRVEETINTSFKPPVGLEYNSTNVRAGVWQCSWEIIQQHWLTGVGAGSERPVLTACYAQFPTEAYKRQYYNTHNQYLNFWLTTGILSVALLLLSLFQSFRLAAFSKNYLLLFFLILVSLTFMTENVLSRQAGIVFYYFFLSYMIAFQHNESITQNRPSAKSHLTE